MGDGLCHKTAERSERVPFLPFRAISAKMTIWSLLLGVALVCPAMIFVELFPVTQNAHSSVLKSISQPGFVILMSTLIGPLLEELVYRGLFPLLIAATIRAGLDRHRSVVGAFCRHAFHEGRSYNADFIFNGMSLCLDDGADTFTISWNSVPCGVRFRRRCLRTVVRHQR